MIDCSFLRQNKSHRKRQHGGIRRPVGESGIITASFTPVAEIFHGAALFFHHIIALSLYLVRKEHSL
jgi:hypothetical protein